MIAAQLFSEAWRLSSPAAWAALWGVLIGLTVALVVLLRTRWRHASAWRKCAALSLWVHILLACLATTVRIVSGSPGLGDDSPMRVRIVADLAQHSDQQDQSQQTSPSQDPADETSLETASPAAFPAPSTDVQDANSITEDAASPDVDDASVERETISPLLVSSILPNGPPKLLDPPRSEPDDALPLPNDNQEEAPAVDPASVESAENEQASIADPANAALEPSQARVAEAGAPPSWLASAATKTASTDVRANEPPATPSVRPIPRAYADRFAPNRQQLVIRRGGNARTERAVKSALAWLAAAQSSDGRWDAARHGAGKERLVLGQDRAGAGANADVGVTGLALLAFLGAGHTHRQGAYSETVAQGLAFLQFEQQPNGAVYGNASLFAQMYCHSMAALAAGEAYAITGDPALDPLVRRAVGYSLSMQHPTDGGWRYAAGQKGDTSQLGWKLMALKSASLGGIEAPQSTWPRVDRFLRSVRRGARGGLAVYRPEEVHPSPTMTAEALLCRLLVGERTGGGLNSEAAREAVDALLNHRPNQREPNLYYWYYGTMALALLREQSPDWDDAWRQWNESLTQTLLTSQQPDGSWSESSVWGGYGGRVYTTALAAMCLEGYYRYAPSPTVGERELARSPKTRTSR